MREVEGDIWSFHPGHWVVIPTNLGWKANGENVMGAGVAKAAAEKFPRLAKWYGSWCREFKEDTPVVLHHDYRVVLFPVKPLNARKPNLSWQSDASLSLIERSTGQLACIRVDEDVVLPLVGCGAGKLAEYQVLPVLRSHLIDNRFVLVRQPMKGSSNPVVGLL